LLHSQSLFATRFLPYFSVKISDIFLLSLLFHKQGELIHQLKDAGAPELDVKRDVAELKSRIEVLEDMKLEMTLIDASCDRAKMKDLLIRLFSLTTLSPTTIVSQAK